VSSCSLGIWAPAAPKIIALSWWSDVDHIRTVTGEHIELAQSYLEGDEYLEPRSAHFEVASPADDEAHPHTFREDHHDELTADR
jgi:hypothetical protein